MYDTQTRIVLTVALVLFPLSSHAFSKFPVRRPADCCFTGPIYAKADKSGDITPHLKRPLSRVQMPDRHPYQRTDLDIMRSEIRELRCMVTELCGALLFSDDMSMLERHTAEMGIVYRDKGFGSFRHPLFARAAIRDVLHLHALEPTPFAHSWIYNTTDLPDPPHT